MEESEENWIVHTLEENSELRFEVEKEGLVKIKVTSGLAEVFGSEMAPNRVYSLTSGSKVAVFTYVGCKLEITGKAEGSYVSKHTPMQVYANLHAGLDQMRAQALKESGRGPRVMIVGPVDVGKSTLCRLLLNYSVRAGRSPVFVDTDVGQGDISIPGTIGALLVNKPADIEEGFATETASVYHFGHTTPSDNLALFDHTVESLADAVNMRGENNDNANASGVVINTCGWVRGPGYKSLIHIGTTFEVDVIAVIDQEWLTSELKRDMPNFVKIIQLPKSGGVTSRTKQVRQARRDNQIRQYFYGVKNNLFPHTFPLSFSKVRIFRIGAPDMPAALMPIGSSTEGNKLKPVPIEPSNALTHKVLSVSMADSDDDDGALISRNVAGFVVIAFVDLEKQLFTILSPLPPPLPHPFLIVMDLSFMDVK